MIRRLVWRARVRWHQARYGDRWEIHSYGCDVCEDA